MGERETETDRIFLPEKVFLGRNVKGFGNKQIEIQREGEKEGVRELDRQTDRRFFLPEITFLGRNFVQGFANEPKRENERKIFRE